MTHTKRAHIISMVVDDGMSVGDAANTFLVPEATIAGWLQRRELKIDKQREEIAVLRRIVADLRRVTRGGAARRNKHRSRT